MRLDALNATQKSSAHNKVPFLKKIRETAKIYHFFRNAHFWWFFLIFTETVLRKELMFFVLHSVNQDSSFELSKSTIGHFFMNFSLRGDPFDFGGVRALRAGEGLVKNGFQSVFLGPYGIPHANKCQAQMIFMDFNLSIRLTMTSHYVTP